MAQTLCSRNHDIKATNTLNWLGKKMFNELFPDEMPQKIQSYQAPLSIHLGLPPLSLMLLTGLVGGMASGIAGLTGYLSKKTFASE